LPASWRGPIPGSSCRRRRSCIPAAAGPGGISISSGGAGRENEITADVPHGLAEARAAVQSLLRDVRARYQPEVLILAGFSQGGMLAMDVALAADPPVDRVAALSGSLIAEKVWRAHIARGIKPAVFMSHGRQDPILPFATSERLEELLRAQGLAVTWLPFQGGHEIPPAVLEGLRAFIAG
jgi:phospholipase/carboxylesterase